MKSFLEYVFLHGKSSANGILQILQTTLMCVSGWQAIIVLVYPDKSKVWAAVTLVCTLGLLERSARFRDDT